jgi:septum formation protein
MALWYNIDRPLILASQSPRRRELLLRLGFAFEVIAPRVADEREHLDPAHLRESVARLSRYKADSVAVDHPSNLVLGSDTVVVSNGEVLGKPVDRGDALRMLELLSGATHQVVSGVALRCAASGFGEEAAVVTEVRFRRLHREEIEQYLTCASYLDKAGAYGIQDAAMAFVEEIRGCYYNVVGLPVAATIALFDSYVRQGSRNR